MPVSWEAVSAVAAVASAIVVAATVLVGVGQVRVAALQVEHLRRATQLEGTMAIFAELTAPDVRAATRFVLHDLAGRMDDPVFREEVAEIGNADGAIHLELITLRTFEKIGVYVKHGLLDPDVLLDYFAPVMLGAWTRLEETGVVAIHRAERGEILWENYEALVERGRRFLEERGPAAVAAAVRPGRLSAPAGPESRSGPEAIPAE